MKECISNFIKDFVSEYAKREDIATQWGEPLVGFADAAYPVRQKLPDIAIASHAVPQDVMEDASIVIVYFVPFTKELAKANRSKDIVSEETGWEMAVSEWARAYEETNAMFDVLNERLVKLLAEHGYKGAVPQQASIFDRERLISGWSHRHFAYAAGLGTFGVNNMLITKNGCCGRYSSVVTNLDVEPGSPVNESGDPAKEYCLYKKSGTCGVCVRNCPSGVLQLDGYDRHKCYEVCLENAKIYTEFGSSYTGTPEDGSECEVISGSEVCGKCVTGSPCAFWKVRD